MSAVSDYILEPMRILLLTPLYPPDIAAPAPYVKELAKRLSATHQTTVFAYTRLPEPVAGVEIVSINKRRSLPLRLLAYTRELVRLGRNADVIYAQNGASVELPLFVASFFMSTPLVLCLGDRAAHERAQTRLLRRTLERLVTARVKNVITELPPQKPIIFPLEPRPDAALAEYEQAWQNHVQKLETVFASV